MSYVSHEQHAACGGLGHSEIKPTESCQDSFAKESLQKLCHLHELQDPHR